MVLYREAVSCLVGLHAVLDGVVAAWVELGSTAEGWLLDLVVAHQTVESLAEVVEDL